MALSFSAFTKLMSHIKDGQSAEDKAMLEAFASIFTPKDGQNSFDMLKA